MFTGQYSVTQGLDSSTFTVIDTSSYTGEAKNTFSGRRIYLYDASDSTVVPDGTTTDYIDFPFGGGDSIPLDVLTKDMALRITVQWVSLDPQTGSTYTSTVLYVFTSYSEQFYYGLTQQQTARPNIVNDAQYFQNKSTLRTYIDDAGQAVSTGNDIYAAQQMLDYAQQMIDNATKFF